MTDIRKKNPDPGPRVPDAPVGERPGGHAAMDHDKVSQKGDVETAAPSESGPCVDFEKKPKKTSKGEPGSRKPGTELTKEERENQAF